MSVAKSVPVRLEAVEDETPVEAVEAKPPVVAEEPAEKKPGRARRVARTLMRITVVTLILAGMAAAGVVGWPIFNERILQPVESTAANTAELQGRQGVTDDRLAAIEGDLAEAARIAQEATAASEANADAIAGLGDDVAAVVELVDGQAVVLDELATSTEDASTRFETSVVAIERRQEILQALDSIARARLYLFEANYGLARADVAAARASLGSIQGGDAEARPDLLSAIERLDRALVSLPDQPVSAIGDLDIAWELLLNESSSDRAQVAPDGGTADSPAATDPEAAPVAEGSATEGRATEG